jgi:hypothetical protein
MLTHTFSQEPNEYIDEKEDEIAAAKAITQ